MSPAQLELAQAGMTEPPITSTSACKLLAWSCKVTAIGSPCAKIIPAAGISPRRRSPWASRSPASFSFNGFSSVTVRTWI